MPNSICDNIYDNIIIMVDPSDKTFYIENRLNGFTVATKIKDMDTALAIRKAYGDGFYDGKNYSTEGK